jgi:hypothetical protein
MSTIFKRSYWATDNGERVKKKTKVYYIKYTDGDGSVAH